MEHLGHGKLVVAMGSKNQPQQIGYFNYLNSLLFPRPAAPSFEGGEISGINIDLREVVAKFQPGFVVKPESS